MAKQAALEIVQTSEIAPIMSNAYLDAMKGIAQEAIIDGHYLNYRHRKRTEYGSPWTINNVGLKGREDAQGMFVSEEKFLINPALFFKGYTAWEKKPGKEKSTPTTVLKLIGAIDVDELISQAEDDHPIEAVVREFNYVDGYFEAIGIRMLRLSDFNTEVRYEANAPERGKKNGQMRSIESLIAETSERCVVGFDGKMPKNTWPKVVLSESSYKNKYGPQHKPVLKIVEWCPPIDHMAVHAGHISTQKEEEIFS